MEQETLTYITSYDRWRRLDLIAGSAYPAINPQITYGLSGEPVNLNNYMKKSVDWRRWFINLVLEHTSETELRDLPRIALEAIMQNITNPAGWVYTWWVVSRRKPSLVPAPPQWTLGYLVAATKHFGGYDLPAAVVEQD